MKVNRETLLRSLNVVRPGLADKKAIIEQSDCAVLLNGEALSFNDELCCRAPTGLDKSFKGAVSAKELTDLLTKMEGLEEVDVTQEDGHLLVKGKRESAGIRTETEITLPYDAVEKPKTWKRLPDHFLEAINIVQTCASNDETQTVLVHVHLTPKWVEACDRIQVARYRIKTDLSQECLVRKESIQHITNLDVTEFSETDAWLHFRNPDGMILSCRRYLEEYKDVSDFLKVEEASTLVLPKTLTEATEKAEIFSSQSADENLLLIELRPDRLELCGRGVKGWYKKSHKISYGGEPMSFLIAPSLLREIVTRHNECLIAPNPGRLKVDGGKWVYVSCLARPQGDKQETVDKPKRRERVTANSDD